MSLKRRTTVLESRSSNQYWPEISFLSWNDNDGSFAAFVPGMKNALCPILSTDGTKETEAEFMARAKARYEEIRSTCLAKGRTPNPMDPLQDVLDAVAKEGRTILNSSAHRGQNDEY